MLRVHLCTDRNSPILVAVSDFDGKDTKAERFRRRATSFLAIFSLFFVPLFAFLHFIGPRRLSGGWFTNEPMSTLPAAIEATIAAIFVSGWLSKGV